MKLRARLVTVIVAFTVPAVLLLSLFAVHARRRALVEGIYEATVQRMESGGRERCEAMLERPGSVEGPRRRGRRGHGRWRHRHHYDESLRPMSPGAPPLAPELARELERGEAVAALWLGSEGPTPSRVRVAMRMPFDGPCAVVVLERPSGTAIGLRGLLDTVGPAILAALLAALVALIALGPLVRRVRRLTRAVRAQSSGGYAEPVPVEGSDEVGDLAAAFNDAAAEIRARLEELAARDRALTEFVASTTHDVMVPLTVLSGHLSRIADDDPAADGSEVAREALAEVHYLTALVKNLAAAARLDAGEPHLTRHETSLSAIVERVVSRHRPLARARRVSLDHALPEDDVVVLADSTLLEQAIGNLVHNAVHYNEEGGHVAVVLETHEGRFEVRVLDDGPGIPEEELARVLERRFRGGEARRRRPTGLGLGLHIVRDVADKHGLELSFERPEGGGLEVRLRGALRGE